MMTLNEIKIRCGEEFDVVPPQVTLHLCLKIEELQAQLLDDGMTLRKIRAFVQKNTNWGMSAKDALKGIKQALEKDDG